MSGLKMTSRTRLTIRVITPGDRVGATASRTPTRSVCGSGDVTVLSGACDVGFSTVAARTAFRTGSASAGVVITMSAASSALTEGEVVWSAFSVLRSDAPLGVLTLVGGAAMVTAGTALS